MDRKKKIAIGVGVVVVLVAGVMIYRNSGGSGGGRQMGGAESTVTVVTAANPTRGDISISSSLTGEVESDDMINVYTKASGDVTAVYVKAGDQVEAGQLLCEIDTEQVDSAKNSLDSAAVNLQEAQSNLARMQILYASGDLSEQDYEQYQNAVKSAQLQYESAEINYVQQEKYSTILAPIAGRIETFDLEVYDRVSTNEQICVIAGEGDSTVTFYVTQRMLTNLEVGDELHVEKNSREYTGYITEISTIVDADTGLFKVKASLERSDEIAMGSTVKITLVTDKTEDAMIVPVDAIYYSNTKAYVYTYQDGLAHMTSVEVGLYDEEDAEILSGLSADDIVVSTWSSNLYEGADIRLRGESGSSADSEAQADGAAEAAEPGAAGEAADGQAVQGQ